MNPNNNMNQTGYYTVQAGDKFNPYTGAALSGNPAIGSRIYAPSGYSAPSGYQQPPVMSADAFNPVKPLNLPLTQYPTSAAGLQGMISSLYGGTLGDLNGDISKYQSVNDYLAGKIGDVFGKMQDKGTRTEQIYTDQGVDVKKQALTDIDKQILDETNALNHSKDAIYNAAGITREQADQQFSEVNRKSLSKQADLAVVRYAASNDYSNAQAIADRKIQMEFEGYQTQLDALKFFYTDNKDSLTTAQDKAFQLKIKKDEASINLAMDQAKTLQQTKLDTLKEAQANGAPTDVLTRIQGSQNPEEAMAAAGNYIGLWDRKMKQAQIDNLNSETKKRLSEIAPPANRTLALASSQNNINLISELANNKYLNTAVGPNTFARTSLSNWFTGGKSNFVAGIEQMRSGLNLDALIQAKKNGATFGALSDNELKVLASSATKIGTWAVKNGKGDVTGYNASETDFKNELDKINNFSRLDYILKGGSPADVGAQTLPDGTVWVKNSNGSYTQIL